MAVVDNKNTRPRRPPATTPEARENQVICAAYDLAEKQIREGTASSQVLTHFLKLGSPIAKLEKDILIGQKKLMDAKTEALQSSKRIEELYGEAMKVMKTYSGQGVNDDDD